MELSNQKTGLTTTKAPFIEMAQNNGEWFIHQPYELYSDENQETWRMLFKLIEPKWSQFANSKFLEGLEALHLQPNRIPRLEEINQFLAPLTGFQAKAVSGYIPSFLFFDCLKKRQFPTTITIRDINSIHYLPEADIFHDIAGHVPMHTNAVFADVLAKFRSLASIAIKRHSDLKDPVEQMAKITSNMQALSRFFWFTVEFGLIQENGKLCAYGSGLLSSVEEITRSVTSPFVQRHPFQLEWVINQSFDYDRMQPLLFVIDSFDQLYDEVNRLEKFLLEGKLDHAAPGEPKLDQSELMAFLTREDL